MQRVIRGIPVSYEDIGSGTPVLMVHGVPGDHGMMRHYLEPIFDASPGWRRIYPDLPGMGGTPGLDTIHDSDDVLDLVLDLVDELAPGERFAVIGVSSGGYFARGVLARRAPRLTGAMLGGPGHQAPRPSGRRHAGVIASDPATVAAVADDERTWLEVSVVQEPETLAAFRTAIKPGIMTADLDFVRAVYRAPLADGNLALAAPFDGPSLVIAGRQDHWCGYRDAQDLIEDLPRATLAVLDRAGHGLAEERPAMFRALVADWLERMELERAYRRPPAQPGSARRPRSQSAPDIGRRPGGVTASRTRRASRVARAGAIPLANEPPGVVARADGATLAVVTTSRWPSTSRNVPGHGR